MSRRFRVQSPQSFQRTSTLLKELADSYFVERDKANCVKVIDMLLEHYGSRVGSETSAQPLLLRPGSSSKKLTYGAGLGGHLIKLKTT